MEIANQAGAAGLLESLRGLRRRVKLLSVAYGVGLVLAAAVGLVLAVVFLDYLLHLPTAARVVVNVAVVGVLGYVLFKYVLKPAIAKLTLSDLAGQVENTFPQFDDTLRSTVYFASQSIPGSSAMQVKTAERASELARSVDLNRAVIVRPVWTSLGIGLAAVALLVVVAALVDPNLRSIAARRLFAGSVEWPKRVEVELVGKSPARIPAGQEFALQMRLKKGSVTQATVRTRYDNGPWQQQVVAVQADGTFTTRLTARLDQAKDAGRLQIAVEAGDDKLELPDITIVPQLELRGATAVVTPPAYIGGKLDAVSALDRTLDVPVGSEIALTLEFNRPLDVAKGVTLEPLAAERAPRPAAWAYPRNGVAVATLKFGASAVGSEPIGYTIAAIDTDGFANRSSPSIKLVVREDGKPSIMIENPADKTEDRTAVAGIPLRAVAEDDFGFASVELVVKGASANVSSFNKVIPLFGENGPQKDVAWSAAADSTAKLKRFLVAYEWELGQLGVALKPGDRLEYFLRARDNFALDGKYHDPVESEHHIINIISAEELTARAEAKASAARQQIDAIKRSVDVSRATALEQAAEAKENQRFDDAQRATAARLADQQSSTAAQTKQVAKQLQDLTQMLKENKASKDGVQKAAEEAAKKLNQAADQPMKEAASQLNQAKDTASDPKASPQQKAQQSQKAAQNLDQAAQQQEKASQELEQAMAQLQEFGGLQSAIEQLETIAREQKRVADEFKKAGKDMIGKKPDELSTEQKQKLDEMTKQQEQLSADTQKAIDKMSEKADNMQKADPASAKAMKQAAQTGQQQGIPQKQSNKKDQNGAAQQMQQNQQANAQQRHKEIELGLEQMLEQLKEAERRQLEKLQKELAEVQKLVDELVFRQANHNLDDLVLQNKVDESFKDEKERDAVIKLAQRDPKLVSQFKADLAELTPQQEQTHRNAQFAAEKAKGLPDATPAGKINAAVTKMEQAAVYLRKSQLAEAYAPPQVEALKNLLEAKKLIDEAKKKADQDMKDRQEESIRQAYVKILEEQKKLDAETKRLDGAKDADGNLKREDQLTLNKLPAKQDELAEQANKLGEKLLALKSVVYAWANKDIVSSMKSVKDDLNKPQTDAVVQAEQTRIEEQLEAMIENLKKKPQDKRFESRAGGGGGGGGGGQKPPPKMPTEQELRLLKDLQQAVNKATEVIDAEVKKANGRKNSEKLLAQGGRQGELRALLDQLLQQASQGKVKLGEEPDDKVQLPEEAKKDDVEDQEFLNDLLNDKLDADTVEKTVKLVGDRMGRSRQRLSLKEDPGQVTQEIQKRIVMDLDNLIQLAQQQQQQGGGQPQPGEGEPGGQPQPGDGQGGPQQAGGQPGQQPGQQQGGTTAAGDSSLSQGGEPQQDLSKVLEEKGAEWGLITGKQRGPARGEAGSKNAPKYDKYIADYYKELAKKASEQK